MSFHPARSGLNANTYCRKFVLYYLRYENASIHSGDNTKHPHCREGVCVGRSYRNRTYTVGVRGPSATTTPSSIAESIIYHIKKFCKYFLQIVKTNSQSLTFCYIVANIISVNRIKPTGCSAVLLFDADAKLHQGATNLRQAKQLNNRLSGCSAVW